MNKISSFTATIRNKIDAIKRTRLQQKGTEKNQTANHEKTYQS